MKAEIKLKVIRYDHTFTYIEVDPNWTIGVLTLEIAKKLSLPERKKITLIRYGCVLDDHKTLSSYLSGHNDAFVYLKGREHKINPGAVLSIDEVMKLADKEFSNDPNKAKIIKEIANKLGHINYEKSLKDNKSPWTNRDGETSSYGFFSTYGDELEILGKATMFVKSLPGVDTAAYRGLVNLSMS